MPTIPVALVVVVLAVGQWLHAQDGLRTPTPPPAPAHNTKVLIGCLVGGPDPTTFKLTNVLPTEAGVDSPARPVGTAGAQTEYELKAEARLDTTSVAPPDLKQFVGHQVEITARPVSAVPEGGPKKAGEGDSAAAAARPEPTIEKLTVTAIKQVFATCR